jgi:putative polyhydroxyalkanoate system protein
MDIHRAAMTTPITITIAHTLGRAQARERIDDGFAKMLSQVPGSSGACTQQWEGDRLRFNLAVLGQSVAGTVDVLDTSVTMQIELPGLLGVVAGAIKQRLQKASQLLLTKQ